MKIFEETGRGDLVELEGYDNVYRFRVGNYRVKMWIEDDKCIVFDLEKGEELIDKPPLAADLSLDDNIMPRREAKRFTPLHR